MAYADAPFGFVPVRRKGSGLYDSTSTPYWVDASDATALFIGDPVVVDGKSNTAGLDIPGMGHFPIGTLSSVVRATAGTGNRVTGVVVGVGAKDRDSEVYRAASTERVVWVADDPDLIFMVQADAALPTTGVGANSNILFAHSGSTSTGRSGAEIDATTATGATNQVVVLRGINDPKNEVNAVGNRFEVMFGLHTNLTAGGIAGV